MYLNFPFPMQLSEKGNCSSQQISCPKFVDYCKINLKIVLVYAFFVLQEKLPPPLLCAEGDDLQI